VEKTYEDGIMDGKLAMMALMAQMIPQHLVSQKIVKLMKRPTSDVNLELERISNLGGMATLGDVLLAQNVTALCKSNSETRKAKVKEK